MLSRKQIVWIFFYKDLSEDSANWLEIRVRNFRRRLAWDLYNVIMYNYRYNDIIMNGKSVASIWNCNLVQDAWSAAKKTCNDLWYYFSIEYKGDNSSSIQQLH